VGEIGKYGILIMMKAGIPNCQAHHIIQEAAVVGYVGPHNERYGRYAAPAIILTTAQHELATGAQHLSPECATDAAERIVAGQALRAAQQSVDRLRAAIDEAWTSILEDI
jgi:hypothetical protein